MVIARIHEAFGTNEYPGDAYIQGSFDGCEPYDEVGAFKGRHDWTALEAGFLDGHYCAPPFFSECGLRFFLPAYIVADLRRELQTADPVFHLTHGFSDHTSTQRVGEREFVRRWGRHALINPRRYGAMTSEDHARCRLSVFSREEAGAIVDYLRWRRPLDIDDGIGAEAIDAALDAFWIARAESAPTAAMLRAHVDEDRAFMDAWAAARKS